MRIYLRRAVLNKLQLRRRRRSIFLPFQPPPLNPLAVSIRGLFHHLDSSHPATSVFRVSTFRVLFLPFPSMREGSFVWDYKEPPSNTYRRREEIGESCFFRSSFQPYIHVYRWLCACKIRRNWLWFLGFIFLAFPF